MLYDALDMPQGEAFDLADTQAVIGAVRSAYADWSLEVMERVTQVEGDLQRWPARLTRGRRLQMTVR